uniref:Uncharacterized protein n=1 Tax=Setaria italica TaxID=4555 RepID=K4A3V9_SETIT
MNLLTSPSQDSIIYMYVYGKASKLCHSNAYGLEKKEKAHRL